MLSLFCTRRPIASIYGGGKPIWHVLSSGLNAYGCLGKQNCCPWGLVITWGDPFGEVPNMAGNSATISQ